MCREHVTSVPPLDQGLKVGECIAWGNPPSVLSSAPVEGIPTPDPVLLKHTLTSHTSCSEGQNGAKGGHTFPETTEMGCRRDAEQMQSLN